MSTDIPVLFCINSFQLKIKWALTVFSASITLLDMNILYRTHFELLGFVNNYYILLMNNIVITFLYILLFITFVIWELKLCLSRQWPCVCVCVQHQDWIWNDTEVRIIHSSTHLF